MAQIREYTMGEVQEFLDTNRVQLYLWTNRDRDGVLSMEAILRSNNAEYRGKGLNIAEALGNAMEELIKKTVKL